MLRLTLAGLSLMLLPSSIQAKTEVPRVISVFPGNGDRSETPVTFVRVTFSGPVKLNSLRLSGPQGDGSIEQVLVTDGEMVPIASTYSYALQPAASQVGHYEASLMAWDAKSRTAYSQTFAFSVGTAEQMRAYDEETERKATMSAVEPADEAESPSQDITE